MSFFSDDKNKPKIEARDQQFTTTAIDFFPALDRGMVIIRATIDNQDSTNNLTFSKNGRGGTEFIVPPNSIALIENEIITGFRITPNGTTGQGIVSADLAVRNTLEKEGFIAGAA